MINIDHLSKIYNARYLFSDVSFNVATRDRIGVIGNNGAGKTTLFEIISGNISPDSGTISMHRGVTIGYLRQDVHQTYPKNCLTRLSVPRRTSITYHARSRSSRRNWRRKNMRKILSRYFATSANCRLSSKLSGASTPNKMPK
jgi:ATPase subunit of ABC transporter with duplicated ATPase domains